MVEIISILTDILPIQKKTLKSLYSFLVSIIQLCLQGYNTLYIHKHSLSIRVASGIVTNVFKRYNYMNRVRPQF